jgi:hypothetical protein
MGWCPEMAGATVIDGDGAACASARRRRRGAVQGTRAGVAWRGAGRARGMGRAWAGGKRGRERAGDGDAGVARRAVAVRRAVDGGGGARGRGARGRGGMRVVAATREGGGEMAGGARG